MSITKVPYGHYYVVKDIKEGTVSQTGLEMLQVKRAMIGMKCPQVGRHSDGDLRLRGPDGSSHWFHKSWVEECVAPADTQLKAGDFVQIKRLYTDEARAKEYIGPFPDTVHWLDLMDGAPGMTGIVVKREDSGDLKVKYLDRQHSLNTWHFNAGWLETVPESTVYAMHVALLRSEPDAVRASKRKRLAKTVDGLERELKQVRTELLDE